MAAEALPLTYGIEIEVSGEIEEFWEVGLRVSGSAGEDSSPEFFVSELGFPRARGAASIKEGLHDGKSLREGEGLEGVDNTGSRAFSDVTENLAIAAKLSEIDDVGW